MIRLIVLILLPFILTAQTAPVAYYQFDLSNPLAPSSGTTNLSGGGSYTIQSSGGIVGKYANWTSSPDAFTGPTINAGSQFTIQFWFRAGYKISAVRNAQWISWGSVAIGMEYPNIYFQTATTSGGHALIIRLDGIGRKSWDYWTDGNWHHIAAVYNASTGRKELWIDGQLPAGFSASVSTGSLGSTGVFLINRSSYTAFYGSLDEIAVYTTALDPRQIYQNYTESASGSHYTTTLAPSVPSADNVTGSVNPLELPDMSVSLLAQLQSYPLPRYAHNHTLFPNFNWVDITYASGRLQPGVSESQAINNSAKIQREMAKNWNYTIQLPTGVKGMRDSAVTILNANPSFKSGYIILRAQIPTKLWNQSLPNDHYLQNSSGQFINPNGAVSTTKYWRPTAPVSSYTSDGITMRNNINATLSDAPAFTGKLSIINENDEVFYLYLNNAMALDPVVTAAKNASGLSWEDFLAKQITHNDTAAYRDIILQSPFVDSNTKYTEYKIDGHRTYQFRYEYKRLTQTPFGNQRYSTGDFYVRYPHNWRYWQGAWHGWQWVIESRKYEIAAGDSLWSPFIAAGWDGNVSNNVLMAQWLGLLKCLALTGAEFFYTGYFNEASSYTPPNPPPNNPAGYAYQIAAPSYVQAMMSRVENEFLRNGVLLEGDVPASYVTPVDPGYSFYAGNINKLVTIRKSLSGNKYLISGTIQPLSNQMNNAPYSSTALIKLNGNDFKFNIRRQGSTYVYDSTVTPPVFYQLDGWHEHTWPGYWSPDFVFEAELYDSTQAATITRHTVRPNTAPSDWTNFTTYIAFSGAGSVNYRFQNRESATYYLYVRARSSDGTAVNCTTAVDGAGTKVIGCIQDTAFQWYRFNSADGSAITYSPAANTDHWLKLTASSNKLHIDQVVLSKNNNLYSAAVTSCSGVTATITPSGPTTFCSGGNVVLTANNGSSYLWNTGATTQSITVTTSGSYVVTVTIAGVGSATSQPEIVTVNSLPTANITPSGPTTFCSGGSVILTATPNSSYLWSTGATTQSITVSNSGSYIVTVTNANGCSKSSAPVSVTVNSAPTALITAGGPTTFCQGSSVVLTAQSGTGYTYQWRRNGTNITGATAPTYTATLSGNYTVNVTASGCVSTSNTISVTVNQPPSTANAGADQTVCVDSTFMAAAVPAIGTGTWTLISGSGTIVSPSSPTSKITSLGVGNNVFRWTVSNGVCPVSTDDVTITLTAGAPVSVTISANKTTFCPSESVTFTAHPVNGGNASYQWKKNGLNVGTNSAYYTDFFSNNDQVYVILTSDLGCVSGNPATSNTITLTQSPNPTVTISPSGPTTFCSGGSVVLTATTNTSYQWYNSSGAISGQTARTLTVTTSETYYCVVTNAAGCTASSNSITVVVNTSPVATITPSGSTTFCNNDSIQLTASPGASYLWSTGATTQSIYGKTTGTFTVTVTSVNGCSASSAGLSITKRSPVTVSINSESTQICIGSTTTMTATSGMSSYLWNTGQTTQAITGGIGNYVVTVTDNFGCTGTASITINGIDCSSCAPPTSSTTIAYWSSAYPNWNSVPGATAYILTLTNDQTGVSRDYTFKNSYGAIKKLSNNTQYSYTIRTVCGTQSISVPSQRWYFKTR